MSGGRFVYYKEEQAMKKSVKGGPAIDLASKAMGLIFKGLDAIFRDLEANGLEKKKEEDIEKEGLLGKYLMYETSSGKTIEVELFGKSDAPDKYLMQIQHDGGKDLETSSKLFSKNEISDYIMEYADEHDLISREPGTDGLKEGIDVNDNIGMEGDTLFQNTKISVTLQRVAAGSEDTINLCAINAGSNAVKAMNILDAVLSDDEFVGQITEEPVSFEIVEMEDAYDVNETQSVDTSNTFEDMLRACVECYHNLQAIHWGSKGEKFRDIHSMAESLLYSVQYNMDNIAEWCVEYTKKVPNVLSYQYNALDTSCGFDFGSGVKAVKQQLDNYIQVLECYYVNVEHDVQSVMDNWIRDLKQQSNYILDRTLLEDACVVDVPAKSHL